MSSDNTKTVARLLEEAQSIQKQMDRLAVNLRALKLKIEKEANSLEKLQVGDLVVIRSPARNGTRCVVHSFTAQRVSVITLDTNEKILRKNTNLTLIGRYKK